jgi:glycosyltransferase involved in cell wall biosynthesis
MKKEIAIILPYKEKYTLNEASAAAIWVKDYLEHSLLKDKTSVFGYLEGKCKPLTSNFVNLDISNIKYKKNYFYTKKFYSHYKKNKYEIIEIHNRPESLVFLLKKQLNCKFIFVYHNNPQDLRFSKSVKERLFIAKNCDQLYFVSNWVMDKFFEGLPFEYKNNCEILYPGINKINKFPKKEKIIIFTGKLNSSKGYDIFGKALLNILNKFTKWKVYAIGNERRETHNFIHKNFNVIDWLPHEKILNYYKKSSISVVCSRWQEPFGRTAMESAGYGCATITSNRGGLPETFNNNLILNKLNTQTLEKLIIKVIKNKNLLRKIQIKNFNNVIHKIENLTKKIDNLKNNYLTKKINYIRNKNLKILHISSFDEKNNHRLFNISISNKITSGFIRNNHDVINFSYKDFNKKLLLKTNVHVNSKLLNIADNYRPDLILLGHNNILNRKTIEEIRTKYNTKFALWYEDHLVEGGPNYVNNLNLIESNEDLIDHYFVTTFPDIIKTRIPKNKLSYMPIPADENIENLEIYNSKNRYKDLFFALSHGVNYGKLKPRNIDERETFLNEMILKNNKFTFNILGYAHEQPKWNYHYFNELSKCKMALNLSRGRPTKYASSNRIASLVANGIMTFIDRKTKFFDFFSNDEMGFYNNVEDLLNQIDKLHGNINKINKISRNGKRKYFSIFNNSIISEYILFKTFDKKNKYKYVWD